MTEPQGLDNLKRIWQGQPTEDTKLTLEQVREKARSFQLQKRVAGLVALPISIGLTILFSRGLARAWVEHRPGGLILIPFLVFCLHSVYHSIILIGTRRIAANAGFKTSLEAYRSHFERERYVTPRAWIIVGLMMLAGTISALGLWIQLPVFPVKDAVEFGFGYVLIGLITYVGIRFKYRQIDHALHLVEGLERDIG
jgi:hypothetical protein